MKKNILSDDGIRIHYEISEQNASKYLFFVHGLGGDLRAWDSERQAFEKLGYTTAALDLRGHGLSGRPDDEKSYDFTNFAEDVHLIIKKEKMKDVVVIGHCLGGMVAMVLEYLYPKKISALVLVDTSYKPPYFSTLVLDHMVIKHFMNLFVRYVPGFHLRGKVDYKQFIGSDDFDKKRILSDLMHTSLKSYLLICKTLLSFNGEKLLDGIHIPTLVIDGKQDKVFPPEIAKHIHKRIKTSQLDVIKDANHILIFSKPDEIVHSILQFFKRISF